MKWAKCNVGATVPESKGLYFSWGNLDGHPAGAGYDFSQAVYDTTPAAAIIANLSLSQDAARVNLGAPWRMPTAAEFIELNNSCSSVWTTLNGVFGRLFTSNVNGNTLFLPAVGGYRGETLYGRNEYGRYWSSKYESTTNARIMSFDSSNIYPNSSFDRHIGFPVRAVQDGTPNRSIIPPIPKDKPKDEETPTTEEPKDKDER